MIPISLNVECGFLIMLINCRLNPIPYLHRLHQAIYLVPFPSYFLSNTHIQSLSLSFFQTPKKFTKIYLTSFILLSFSFLIPIPIKRCEYKFEMRKGSRNVSFRKIGREREIANMCVLMRYELGCISKKYF